MFGCGVNASRIKLAATGGQRDIMKSYNVLPNAQKCILFHTLLISLFIVTVIYVHYDINAL